MDRKNIPVLLMLTAGAITCVTTFIRNDSMLRKLVVLFLVLIFFYGMGTVIKWAFDAFEKNNSEANASAGDEIVEEEEEEE